MAKRLRFNRIRGKICFVKSPCAIGVTIWRKYETNKKYAIINANARMKLRVANLNATLEVDSL